MSSDVDATYAEVDKDNYGLRDYVCESREGFMDPRPNKSSFVENKVISCFGGGSVQEEQVSYSIQVTSQIKNKSGKVRRVKSNGP